MRLSSKLLKKGNRISRWTLENVIEEVLLSIRGSYLAIWSLPLTNVKWHSDPWPVTVTSQPIRLFTHVMTLIPSLIFLELRVISMWYLQQVWHANRERLPLRTPVSSIFWDLLMLQLLRPAFPNLSCLFSTFHLEYPSVLSRFCCLYLYKTSALQDLELKPLTTHRVNSIVRQCPK